MNASLTISSNIAPPVVLDASMKGAAGNLLKLIRPTIDGQIEGIPFHKAPWGEASPAAGNFILAVVVALVAVGAWTIARRLFR